MYGNLLVARIISAFAAFLPLIVLVPALDTELTDEGLKLATDWRVVLGLCFGTAYAATGGDRVASIIASCVVVGVVYELAESRPRVLGKYFKRYRDHDSE